MSLTLKFQATPHAIDGPHYPFNEAEVNAASDAWGCNCGPSALAAILGVKLDTVRPHIPDFDAKRYTNPTMMKAALKSLGVGFDDFPVPQRVQAMGMRALVRIQWEGPWTKPGVPPRVAYGKTHWVASLLCTKSTMVFDVNGGWLSFDEWKRVVVPDLLNFVKGSTGWHTTHRYELMSFPTP